MTRTNHWLGQSSWSSNDYFQGAIKSMQIWRRALGADEVAALYALDGVCLATPTPAPTPAPTPPPTPAPTACPDEWAGLVGVSARSMSFPTAQYTDLFSSTELAPLHAAWALGESWTMTMRATSTCGDLSLIHI